jgi:hypothetical protein
MALFPIPESLSLSVHDYNSQIHFAQHSEDEDQEEASIYYRAYKKGQVLISGTCYESPTSVSSDRSLPWSDDDEDYVSLNSEGDLQSFSSQEKASVTSSSSLTRPRKPLPIPLAQNNRHPFMARSL